MILYTFDEVLLAIRQIIGGLGALVIFSGSVIVFYQVVKVFFHNSKLDLNYIRLNFAKSIALGLELLVGADIVGSLVKPNYYELGILAILVVLRTLIGYYLDRELKAS